MSQTTTAPSPQDQSALTDFLKLAAPIMGTGAPLVQQIGRLLQQTEQIVHRVLNPVPEPRAEKVPVFKGKDIILPNGMEMKLEEFQERWAKLTAPFPEDELENRPQPVGQDKQRYKCEPRAGRGASVDGKFCGGYHTPSTHFTYVGHAGITDRLNDVDPFWYARFPKDRSGFPLMSDKGVMWGELTVLGITRLGVGDVGRNTDRMWEGNAQKELIGDFYRNGAMRFGVGTYLWAKSAAAERKQRGEYEAKEAELVWGNREQAAQRKEEDERETVRIRQDLAAEASQTRQHPNSAEPASPAPGSQTRLNGEGEQAPPARRGWDKPYRRMDPKMKHATEEQWWSEWDYYADHGAEAFEYFKDVAMHPKSNAPEKVMDGLDEALQKLRQLETFPENTGDDTGDEGQPDESGQEN